MVFYSAWSCLWNGVAPNSLPATTFFPPKSTYNPARDVPEQNGKVVLITGGGSGIGYETTKQLLLKGAKVYITARNAAKAAKEVNKLEHETGKRPVVLSLDLTDLSSVQACASEFLAREEKLDLLYCNAGVIYTDTTLLTKQGYDLQYGVSIVGHYVLATALLPALRRAYEASGSKPRVLWTSSALHTLSPGDGLLLETLKGGPSRDAALSKWSARGGSEALYNLRTLGAVLVAGAFDRAHAAEIVSAAVHPGLLETPLLAGETGVAARVVHALAWPAEMGAYTLLFAGTAQEGDSFGGKYLIPWARVGLADKRARDLTQQDKLKRWLDTELAAYL